VASGRRDRRAGEPRHRRWAGAALVAAVAASLAAAALSLPREGAPLPQIARDALTIALPEWHLTEPVNELVYGTRGFDTFAETFLLLAAVIGVLTIGRRRERRRGFLDEEQLARREQAEVDPHPPRDREQQTVERAEEEEMEPGEQAAEPDREALHTPWPERAGAMTVVVRVGVRVAAPVLAVAGLYLVAWGFAPGGGFPGGAVVVGVVLLVYAAYGYRKIKPVVRPDVLEVAELVGAVAIVVTLLLGLVLRGSFSANFLPLGPLASIRSGGIVQVFSGSELVEVATGLALAIFGLLGMTREWVEEDQDQDESEGEGEEAGERR
jgi:multicomponent Na+:H+ antiporter subunit B